MEKNLDDLCQNIESEIDSLTLLNDKRLCFINPSLKSSEKPIKALNLNLIDKIEKVKELTKKSMKNLDSLTQVSQENSMDTIMMQNSGNLKKIKNKKNVEFSINFSNVCNSILPLKFLTCYIGFRAAELSVEIKRNKLKAQGIKFHKNNFPFFSFLRFEEHLAKLINIQNFEDNQIDELNSFLDKHDLWSVDIDLEFIQSNKKIYQ